MKRSKKKAGVEGVGAPLSEHEDDDESAGPGSDTATGDQNGIDAIRALQFGAIAFFILFLIWYVLRFVMHVI